VGVFLWARYPCGAWGCEFLQETNPPRPLPSVHLSTIHSPINHSFNPLLSITNVHLSITINFTNKLPIQSAAEREGSTKKCSKEFCLKGAVAKARIWPRLSYVCPIFSTSVIDCLICAPFARHRSMCAPFARQRTGSYMKCVSI
jgi:hypothetical protein